MSGIVYKMQLTLRPLLVQVPRRDRRADDIVSPLHDCCRNIPDTINILLLQQLPVFQPRFVGEVMDLEPCVR